MKRSNVDSNTSNRKRRRNPTTKIPSSSYDNEHIEVVSSPLGPLETLPLSNVDKEILIERFKTELIERFHLHLSRRSRPATRNGGNATHLELDNFDAVAPILQSRILVGINQCTRAIMAHKAYENSDTLLILARDFYPPTSISHLPFLCLQRKIPILLIPGNASTEMGKMMGTKKVSSILLLDKASQHKEDLESNYITHDATVLRLRESCHNAISSYIRFAKSMCKST